jgi:hypothetical protein
MAFSTDRARPPHTTLLPPCPLLPAPGVAHTPRASGWPALAATSSYRSTRTGWVAGDGQPARLELLGGEDRYVLFPLSFRGELAQYMERQHAQGATNLFESNRHWPYSTRRLRQIVKQYATAAGIAKRVYPHPFGISSSRISRSRASSVSSCSC